ncbi:class I adenylate-forming enzyme family protein [Dactylosporangium sp. McL0621]|uniref:class I adenylate-forming enzyme family protein n=1 Tax=Dactylosporangium sp. McL0621 TaxID=3415678 RepID=UPI003CE89F13
MTNLARLADAALERFGDHPSLWFEGSWYTSGALHDTAARIAGGLWELGVRPGERVVVVMANCPEVSMVYQAVWRAGAVVTPVVFLVTAQELQHILADSGAVAVVTSPELVPKFGDLGVRTLVVGTAGFDELRAADPLPIVDVGADALAALLYTGGTTGRSKGVPLTHANLSAAGASSRAVSYTPGLNLGLTALPMSHSYGMLLTVGALHAKEASVAVLQRWFDPAAWLALAAQHRVQVAAVVPSMLVMLLAHDPAKHDLSTLQRVYSGAAPLPRAVAEAFERAVPSARVLEGYGCTETGGILTATPPDAPRPGTVGRAVPGVELRLAEDGEIVVRGANVMSGYWRGEPVAGGWFATGDIGRLDEDGYLTIVDRKKDIIIRGGFNVYPRDVEDVLAQHPAVAMAAVVGRPDERLGEEVVAFVVLREPCEPADLEAFAGERLAPTKRPRDIRIVEEIPLTSVGKLNRKALRASLRP